MIVLYYLAGLYVLWVYYLAVMNLKRAIDAGTAPMTMKVLGYCTVLPPAVLVDWIMNMVLTIPFLDLPAHPGELVTGRLKRYAYQLQHWNTWREKVAVWFASILDACDPSGKHI